MNFHQIDQLEQENLLGYLLNSLDEPEMIRIERELLRKPHLRSELATLQREVAPLNYISDPVEPPNNLAKRTCVKIWDILDKQEEEKPDFLSAPVLELHKPKTAAPLRRFDTPPHRLLRKDANKDTHTEKETAAPIIAQIAPKKIYFSEKPPKKRWVSFFSSVVLGMLIAFMLFPLIKFAKHSTFHYVKENQLQAINQRLDPYEQINSPQTAADTNQNAPLYLGQFGWKELKPDASLSVNHFLPVGAPPIQPASVQTPHQFSGTIRGQNPFWEGRDIPISLKTNNLSDGVLVPQRNEIRTGYGQNILLKDGKILIRDLPIE
ncbi:hypothetical protein FACS189419_08350 [Planctomycetales bacterium]|nr:hypothetical protein FACS189419_08350 [Planctomycetales bacterium]